MALCQGFKALRPMVCSVAHAWHCLRMATQRTVWGLPASAVRCFLRDMQVQYMGAKASTLGFDGFLAAGVADAGVPAFCAQVLGCRAVACYLASTVQSCAVCLLPCGTLSSSRLVLLAVVSNVPQQCLCGGWLVVQQHVCRVVLCSSQQATMLGAETCAVVVTCQARAFTSADNA